MLLWIMQRGIWEDVLAMDRRLFYRFFNCILKVYSWVKYICTTALHYKLWKGMKGCVCIPVYQTARADWQRGLSTRLFRGGGYRWRVFVCFNASFLIHIEETRQLHFIPSFLNIFVKVNKLGFVCFSASFLRHWKNNKKINKNSCILVHHI